jgi:hypothetical protein
MPDSTTFVSASLVAARTPGTTASSKTFKVVQDPDGHHLRFEGLHLNPFDSVSVQYTVLVNSGASQPASGTLLDPGASSIGSSSTPHTPAGVYISGPIEVIGPALFDQPSIRTLAPKPQVSANVNATANALTAIYNVNPSALPLTNSTDPTSIIPGVQRYYIHFKSISAATGVTLNVPLPAHTVFYRAAVVTLPANQAAGQPGYLPGTVVPASKVPKGWSISAHDFLAAGGSVNFNFATLAAGFQGDIMVEVIVTQDAIQQDGSLVGAPSDQLVAIHDNTVQSQGLFDWLMPKKSVAKFAAIPIANAQSVPKVGISKTIPTEVTDGQTFQVQIAVYNYGDVAAHAIGSFKIPQNTTFVSADAGQTLVVNPSTGNPGDDVFVNFVTNNGPLDPNSPSLINPHTAAAVTITLRANRPGGALTADVVDDSADVAVQYLGHVFAGETKTTILPSQALVGPSTATRTMFTGVPLTQYVFNGGAVNIIDIGGGNVVATGAGNLIGQDGAGVVAQGAGNIIATGAGNLIPVGVTNAASLMANQSAAVANHAANIVVPQGCTIVAAGAGNLYGTTAGQLVSTNGGNIVAAGAGNIVAAGAGNIVSAGAGN